MRKDKHDSVVAKLVAEIGGPTKVAKICGVTSQAVSQWEAIPVKHVVTLEPHTKLNRHQIRPDIFGDEAAI